MVRGLPSPIVFIRKLLSTFNLQFAERPHLRLRREATKGHKARCVPLCWGRATLADLCEWQALRAGHGAGKRERFVCSVPANWFGESLQRHAVRRRFLSACKMLGTARLRTLTIHHGRHTFISHALAGGRTLAEVWAAAGHSNVATTSVYLHVVVDEADAVGICSAESLPIPSTLAPLNSC